MVYYIDVTKVRRNKIDELVALVETFASQHSLQEVYAYREKCSVVVNIDEEYEDALNSALTEKGYNELQTSSMV